MKCSDESCACLKHHFAILSDTFCIHDMRSYKITFQEIVYLPANANCSQKWISMLYVCVSKPLSAIECQSGNELWRLLWNFLYFFTYVYYRITCMFFCQPLYSIVLTKCGLLNNVKLKRDCQEFFSFLCVCFYILNTFGLLELYVRLSLYDGRVFLRLDNKHLLFNSMNRK